MTSITTAEDTRREDPRRRARAIGELLVVTSVIQIGFGVALLVAPGWMAPLLTGDPVSPELARVLRTAGIASLAIGACCALGRLSETGASRSRPLDLVPGLVVYNGCAVAVLADAILRGAHAPLLWPAWVLHSALLVWSVAALALERAARR